MPLSTSSSERAIPQGQWGLALILGGFLALIVITGWEVKVRGMHYAPTLNDTADLWSESRCELAKNPDRTVLVGASRTQFDFDLDVFAAHFGTDKPIQLSLVGSKPLPVLENIAQDETFTGTVIVGVTPGLYFVPQGPPVARSTDTIRRYDNWSPSQKSGHEIGKILQRSFALINQEDLTLDALLKRLPLDNRAGTAGNLPPQLPPYFSPVTEDRRARMWDQCDFGSPLAERIQKVWIPLFTPPPPPPMFTQEEFMAMFMESVERDLARTAESVNAIRSRGGNVVFVRFPSSGKLRELENQFSPRQGFWDRILAASQAPGIHFEDHESLRDFECPEWSHLRVDDSRRFSENLMPLLERALADAGTGADAEGS